MSKKKSAVEIPSPDAITASLAILEARAEGARAVQRQVVAVIAAAYREAHATGQSSLHPAVEAFRGRIVSAVTAAVIPIEVRHLMALRAVPEDFPAAVQSELHDVPRPKPLAGKDRG